MTPATFTSPISGDTYDGVHILFHEFMPDDGSGTIKARLYWDRTLKGVKVGDTHVQVFDVTAIAMAIPTPGLTRYADQKAALYGLLQTAGEIPTGATIS